MANGKKTNVTTVGDKDGKLISDLKLSQTAPNPIKFLDIDGEEKVPSFENFSDDDDPPSMLSIEEADKKFKKLCRSSGIGEIS